MRAVARRRDRGMLPGARLDEIRQGDLELDVLLSQRVEALLGPRKRVVVDLVEDRISVLGLPLPVHDPRALEWLHLGLGDQGKVRLDADANARAR